MKHKLTVMGLALAAFFAFSAVATSVASAEGTGTFTWSSNTTTLDAVDDGEGHQTFVTTPGTVTCNNVTGYAEVKGEDGVKGSEDVTTSFITYNNNATADTCPGPFGTNPKIEMNGCGYTFTPGTTLNGMETTGTAHIVCPGTNKIKINAPGCTIEVGAQNNLEGHVIYRTITNAGGLGIHDVTLEATLSGIDYNHFGLLCGTASRTNGTYTGNVTITGTDAVGNQTSVEVH